MPEMGRLTAMPRGSREQEDRRITDVVSRLALAVVALPCAGRLALRPVMVSADVFGSSASSSHASSARISSIVSQPDNLRAARSRRSMPTSTSWLRRGCEKSEFQALRSTHRWLARIVSRRRCQASDSRRIPSASARRSPASKLKSASSRKMKSTSFHALRGRNCIITDSPPGFARTILREMYRLDPAMLPRGLVEDFRGAIDRAVIDNNPALRQTRLRRHAGNQSG